MLEPRPPRRDPRVLLVDTTTDPRTYAALDAWELRGIGELPRQGASAALLRLALQLRPSHIVLVRSCPSNALYGLGRALREIARRGLPVVSLAPTALPSMTTAPTTRASLCRAFPELRHLAPSPMTAALTCTVRRALAVLLHHPLPPRRYAPRLPARTTPRVAR